MSAGTARRLIQALTLCVVLGLASLAQAQTPGINLIIHSGGHLVLDAADDSWQLPEDNYQQSIFPLEQVYPRDQEDRTTDGGGTTPTWAYHLLGPTVHDKVIRIGTRGGCPPWHYDLTGTTLVGATIENDSDLQTYGALTIPAQSAGTYTISVTTDDQCSNQIVKSWTYTVADHDGSNFVHITAGSGGTEAGTHANPKRTLGQVLGPDEDDTTWNDRQIILSGTHTLIDVCSAADCNAGRVIVLNANKPQVWMGTGDALLQGSTDNSDGGSLGVESGTDWVFSTIGWRNPLQNVGGLRNRFLALSDYGGLFDSDVDMTTTTDDTNGQNSAAIFLSATPTWDFIAIIGNTFHDGNAEIPPIEFYDANDVLISMNEYSDSSNNQGWYTKGGEHQDRWAYYFNFGTGNTGFALFTIDMIDFTSPGSASREDFEFMHNRFQSSGICIFAKGTNDGGALTATFGITSKRNNWKCTHHYFQGSDVIVGGSDAQFDAMEHSGTYSGGWRSGTAACGSSNVTCSNNTQGTSGILNDTTAVQDAPNCETGREICTSALIPANDDIFDVRLAA